MTEMNTATVEASEVVTAESKAETPTMKVVQNKIVHVPLDNIMTMVPGWNVREPTKEAHTNPDVKTIAYIGQKEAGLLYLMKQKDLDTWAKRFVQFGVKAGTLLPVRGNIRATEMKELRTQNVIDPLTLKKDAAGNVIPGSGKVFETFRAEVLQDLDEATIFALMNDHTSKRLSDKEVYLALERALNLFPNETDAAVHLFGLLLATSKKQPSEKQTAIHTEEGRTAWKNFCKGRIDTTKRLMKAPTVLREAYLKVIAGKDSRPNNDEFKAGTAIHVKEQDEALARADLGVSIATPGPLFTKWWDDLQTELKTAADEGRDAKRAANKNAAQIDEKLKGLTSIIMKGTLFMVQNKTTGDQDVILNRIAFAVEQGMSPELRDELAAWMKSVQANLPTAVPTV